MHWRDILTIGLNHHLLYADRSADPEAHCESLLRILADERLEAVDLWIPGQPAACNPDETPTPKPKKTDTSKVKQTCPSCHLNAWAKLGSTLICGECKVEMISEDGLFTDQFPFSI